MTTRGKKWLGGYVRETAGGEPVYIIEREIEGARYHVSTRCSTEKAAFKQLERFEAAPASYRPGGELVAAVRLTADLALGYRKHQLAHGVTVEWADEVGRCLADWIEKLGTKDLRALDLHRDIKPKLDEWPTRRPHRIKALKGLFRWLKEEKGLVTQAQDGTASLRVPQAKPEKQKRRKAVAPEHVAEVLKVLVQPTHDILHLLTATAWHCSEVRRFALGGEIVDCARVDGGPIAVLVTQHKSGDLTRTPILYEEHLEAAKRIRALKKYPKRMTTARHMQAACAEVIAKQAAAGVKEEDRMKPFGLGVMRHSVLTWGVDRGANIKAASEFAQHKSENTTRRFYIDLAVPKASIPILRLVKA